MFRYLKIPVSFHCKGNEKEITNTETILMQFLLQGVKIYGVEAGNTSADTTVFNNEMARITGGKRLTLNNFGCIFDVLMMICYREGNPEMLAVS